MPQCSLYEVLAYPNEAKNRSIKKNKKNIKAFLAFVIWITAGIPHSVRCFPGTEDATPALPKKFMVYVVAQDGACFVRLDFNCKSLH